MGEVRRYTRTEAIVSYTPQNLTCEGLARLGTSEVLKLHCQRQQSSDYMNLKGCFVNVDPGMLIEELEIRFSKSVSRSGIFWVLYMNVCV